MKIYIWVSHLHLENLKKLVDGKHHQSTKYSIRVYPNNPKKWENHFQVQIEYDTYLRLLEDEKIQCYQP